MVNATPPSFKLLANNEPKIGPVQLNDTIHNVSAMKNIPNNPTKNYENRVDILIMYAVQIQNLFFQGATTVCDHELACQEMPIYLKNILSKETFQVRVLEKGYYIKGSPSDWFTLPVFTDYGWGNSMYIYLPFINQAHASWESRILGFSDLENNSFFNELRLFLTKPKYYYRHFWTQGDLMIKDNRRVLHAREEYDEKATRLIYRGQVIDK